MKNKSALILALSMGLIFTNPIISNAETNVEVGRIENDINNQQKNTNENIDTQINQDQILKNQIYPVNATNRTETIQDLINKIDNINISPNERAKLAMKMYEIMDRTDIGEEEKYRLAKEEFDKAVAEAEKAKGKDNGIRKVSEVPGVDGGIFKTTKTITGTGIPGSRIELYYDIQGTGEGQINPGTTIKVGDDGKWSATLPVWISVNLGAKINIIQIEEGKLPSAKVTKEVTTEISEQIKDAGGLKAKDTKVFQGQDINWTDGVDLADNFDKSKSNLIDEIKNAKVTDNSAIARSSQELGEKSGEIKLTFSDSSTLTISQQKLIVYDKFSKETTDLPKGGGKSRI